MTKDRLIRNPKLAANQVACLAYLFSREAKRLRIGKIRGSWEVDDEIVTEPILRERRPVAVRDLSTWSWNIENVHVRASFCVSNVGMIVSSSGEALGLSAGAAALAFARALSLTGQRSTMRSRAPSHFS